MVNFTIYAGGYVSFIASFLFDSDAASLTLLKQNPSGQNPSWISSHPTNSSILYAVNELAEGLVQSYLIGDGGSLSGPLDTIGSGGSSPAHAVALSTGQVVVMNYGSGNGVILSTTNGGVTFGTASLVTFPVPSSGASHPHMIYQYDKELFVPDLGADTVYRLTESESGGNWIIDGSVDQQTGSGPRHISICNNVLYTLHELSSTLTSQRIPIPPANSSTFISSISIIPSNPPAGAMFAAAEILIPSPSVSFPAPFIYASNRNTGVQDPNGDAIAIFQFDPFTGIMQLVKEVFTGLDQVRGMQFGGDDDRYLVAGGVAGTGGIVIFERVDGGRDLQEVVRNTEMLTATSFIWTS